MAALPMIPEPVSRARVAGRIALVPAAAFALVALAACGGESTPPGGGTSVPAVESTVEATPAPPVVSEASPAPGGMETAAAETSPAAEVATATVPPAAESSPAASPVARDETAATPEAATPEATAAESAQAVTVTVHDIYFDPKAFTIPADTDVTVNLPNEGAAPHNFSIDALAISVDLPPGETKDVVVNAPAGEYEYYCDVPGHKEAGMVGKMTAQ